MYNDESVTRLHRRVRESLERTGLGLDKTLIVAVSGGPDSLAMLHSLHHLRNQLDFRLHGAHLDHGLRGDASKSDAKFVAETFRALGVPYDLEEADVGSLRNRHRQSLEEAARAVRYSFLARVAVQQGADAVALGHTADDQAETVLMNIMRGTGLTGLKGMEESAIRSFGGNEIVLLRPLLQASRQETEGYCRALHLEPRRDESNLSPELTRNWVRLELLPILQRRNPAVQDALVRLSRSAALDMAYIGAQIDQVWEDVVRPPEGGASLSIDRSALARLDPALQRHLLRRAVEAVKGDLENLEQSHVEEMARLLEGSAGRSLDLPGRVSFTVGYAEATISAADTDPCPLPPLEGEWPLSVPGETRLPGWRVTAQILQNQLPDFSRRDPGATGTKVRGSTAGADRTHGAHLDYESLDNGLNVRGRSPGDRFQPLGMSQPKKLQDFMVDSKIPRSWRDRVPLVVSPGGIAWVVGWRIADWARVRDSQAHVLELRFLPEDGDEGKTENV